MNVADSLEKMNEAPLYRLKCNDAAHETKNANDVSLMVTYPRFDLIACYSRVALTTYHFRLYAFVSFAYLAVQLIIALLYRIGPYS